MERESPQSAYAPVSRNKIEFSSLSARMIGTVRDSCSVPLLGQGIEGRNLWLRVRSKIFENIFAPLISIVVQFIPEFMHFCFLF
jgi:hypothetical protein